MLVLSRKPDESILIDGNIRVTVLAIRGGQVRLGIEAPGEVTIFREELCLATHDVGVAAHSADRRLGVGMEAASCRVG